MAPIPALPVVDVDPTLVAVLLSPWLRIGALLWGALWGSFANVAIFRLPLGMSLVRPRSRCPACERPIAAYDNVPVLSYLLLRGRCRHCKAKVSIRYPMVEMLGAVLSFALWIRLVQLPLVEGGEPHLAVYVLSFFLCLALVVVAYVDLDYWIIPNEIVLPGAGIGLLVAALRPEWFGVPVLEAAATSAVGYVAFWAIRAYYRRFRGIEGLGLGDAKLLVMVGAWTGAQGLLFTVGAGALQGLLVAVPLLLLGRRVANTDLEEVHGADPELGHEDPDKGVMGRRVPFGPFLALAAIEYCVLRPTPLRWLDAGLALLP